MPRRGWAGAGGAVRSGSDTPCRLVSSGGGVGVVRPCGRFVVESAGLEASVQDADEAVADLPQGRVVAGLTGALFVVVAAGAGRGAQGGERLGLQRVGEAVVADVAGL